MSCGVKSQRNCKQHLLQKTVKFEKLELKVEILIYGANGVRTKHSPTAYRAHTMRVPLSLLFVGWWVARQRWTVAEPWYSKPSISVSPEMVLVGGNVTVRCSETWHSGATFFLRKIHPSGSPNLSTMTRDYVATFIISNIHISDAGIYQCIYGFVAGSDSKYSHESDAVHINVTDPDIPKPSIKVNRKGHSNFTVECRGPEKGLNFFLRKANTREISHAAAQAAAKAVFQFIPVRMEDAGSYICQYHRKSTPFVWSVPSDSVELIWKDTSLPKPTIKVSPKGRNHVGATVTIGCTGPENGLNFSLHKAKNFTALQMMNAKGDTANFFLPALRLQDAGNYTCQYYHKGNPYFSSEPSDSVRVIVKDRPEQTSTAIIGASAAAGLLLALFLLLLILMLCKRRKKCSTVNEGNQPANKLLEQNAGTDCNEKTDQDGVTYAVLSQYSVKIKRPASQPTGPESCIYASVAKGRTRKA